MTKKRDLIYPAPRDVELLEFTTWFHMDWDLVFSDFYSGAKMYIDNLPENRRRVLSEQLEFWLEKKKDLTDHELKMDWIRIGAGDWQKDLKVRETLYDFLKYMKTGKFEYKPDD